MSAGECEVWFYHLERSTQEQVLPELLEKTLSRGWKALVKIDDPDRLEVLDNWLWTYRDDSFLPHGRIQEPLSERQPILLTDRSGNPTRAQALFVLDGDPGELEGFNRCIVIFDGREERALAAARGLWKAYKSAGRQISYWRQGEARGWTREG